MNKILKLSFIFIFIILAACNRYHREDKLIKPTLSKASWLIKFLEDPTCQPPCWENIIPGKTTISDAIIILEANPNVKIINTYSKIKSDIVEIHWNFVGTTERGLISSTRDGETISDITLFTYSLSLSDMSESYGSPSFLYTSLGEYVEFCHTTLIYESLGLSLDIDNHCTPMNTTFRYTLTQETIINRISFNWTRNDWWLKTIFRGGIDFNGYGEYEESF